MKRHIKIAVSCVFYALRWPIFALARVLGLQVGPYLVILYYHDVPASKRAAFARQLDLLARRATVVGADWRGGQPNGRFCAITFDDAFLSALFNALPELSKRQMPCTIFVPVGNMGKVPNWVMETNLTTSEMVANQDLIRSLPSSLVTVGAHTVSHPYLSRISRQEARSEVELSRSTLSAVTGVEVRLMSFPYGDYDQEVVAMCKESGYDFVYGIDPKPVDPRAGEFVRARVSVEPDDGPLEFCLKISGAYQWMPLASTLKRALTAPYSFLTKRSAHLQ